MFKSIIICIAMLAIGFQAGAAHSHNKYDGIRNLIARQVPFLRDKVIFIEKRDSLSSHDSFTIYTNKDKLFVEATSQSAASTAINFYINQYCNMSISHNGNNVGKIHGPIPEVRTRITKKSRFKYRYALNYCTYNYSYSFNSWKDWEKELDWMSLNGINLMLAPLGCELVWYNVLMKFGYNEDEIMRYIAGPGYTAWWLMGNLEGWGGPMSYKMMRQRADMQKKILIRMSELGIEPILQGFSGIIPSTLSDKFPSRKIKEQGKWVHLFQRPSLLLPENPLFNSMADCWYSEIKKVYGNHIKYFGGDLFHEGGDTTGIDLKASSNAVQSAMQKNFPCSKWILQSWGDNPKRELLSGTDPKYTIVIDLFGESESTWKNTNEFQKTPWIWATVNHFGGKTDMGGQLPLIIKEPHKVANESSGLLCGIGIIPEGIFANPVVYDWALKTAWEKDTPSVESYINNYVRYRYGKEDDNLNKAWRILCNSVYGDFVIKGEGTFESILCARPGLNVTNVSAWGPKYFQYSPQDLIEALKLFILASKNNSESETFSYDLADLARQVLSNYARNVYEYSIRCFNDKNLSELITSSQHFVNLIKLQDLIVGTQNTFLVGTWLNKALKYGKGRKDRLLSERNAKMLITYWGPEDKNTRLRDYANKEWSGLLTDYYLPRWQAFYNYLINKLIGEDVCEPDYFSIEKEWVNTNNHYPIKSNGKNIIDLVSILLADIQENN